jgi:hypothetical protein
MVETAFALPPAWFGVWAIMEFLIKCHLGYEVSGPASFLFNIAVAQNSFQRIITEHVEVHGVEHSQEMARAASGRSN